MKLHKIVNELENLDMQQREYRQAVEALVAAESYFLETIQEGDKWTREQVVKMRKQAGIERALEVLASVAPPADDYDEDDLDDE